MFLLFFDGLVVGMKLLELLDVCFGDMFIIEVLEGWWLVVDMLIIVIFEIYIYYLVYVY